MALYFVFLPRAISQLIKDTFVNDSSTQAESTATDKLPMSALLALAMTGFICIVTETLPAGLLPQISEGLRISQALAGQMVTAYALGSLLAAIPLTIATRSWRRRNVLLLTIIGFFVFNSVTALSNSYSLTLVARFFAGVAAGLAWSLLAAYARRMVASHQQGRAMAVAMVGIPIALSFRGSSWDIYGLGSRLAYRFLGHVSFDTYFDCMGYCQGSRLSRAVRQ
jgi:MFS family permease